jgi:hypothetical protein
VSTIQLAAIFAAFAVSKGPSQNPSVTQIQGLAAQSLGGPLNGAWNVKGAVKTRGVQEQFETTFDSAFRFRDTLSGPLPQEDGFDGSTCWAVNASKIPHNLILQDRDVNRILAWTWYGDWTRKDVPLEMKMTGPDTLTLRPKDGLVVATMQVDSATGLPKALSYWTSSGDEVYTFVGYKPFNGRMFPTQITHQVGKQVDVTNISDASPVSADERVFRMPKPEMSDTTFLEGVDPRVEVKSINKHLFVHPLVDGQDIGWFFLDTGADVMAIDPGAAKKLNMVELGRETTAGVVAVTELGMSRAKSFQLGPVKISNPMFYQFDLAAYSKAFNDLPLAGICGYDYLARTTVDLDRSRTFLTVTKPGGTILPKGAHWTSIDFDEATPCIKCRFEGEYEGYFNLDTGSSSTVDFCTPAVEKYGLLRTRQTTSSHTGGAGGVSASREGNIAWFELAGHRFQNPSVGLQITKQGEYASPYLTGNIGNGFLGAFRLVFDYQNQRIAFVR